MKRRGSPLAWEPAKSAKVAPGCAFDDSKEIQLSEVNPDSPKDAFFKARVTMRRPSPKDVSNLQLQSNEYPQGCTADAEIDFSYSNFSPDDIALGDWFAITLTNVKFTSRTDTFSSSNLPWNLCFTGNWTMKLIKSSKHPDMMGSFVDGLIDEDDSSAVDEDRITNCGAEHRQVLDFLEIESSASRLNIEEVDKQIPQPQSLEHPPDHREYNSTKIGPDSIPNKYDDDKVYVHNLGDDPVVGEASYSFDQHNGPPRNAYAALLKSARSTPKINADVERTGPQKGRKTHHPAPVLNERDVNKISIEDNAQQAAEQSGKHKKCMSRVERLMNQIQLNEHTGESSWNGQTYAELLRAKELQGHVWSKTKRKTRDIVLSLMERMQLETSRARHEEQNFDNQNLAVVTSKQEARIAYDIDPDLVCLEAGFVSPREHFRAISSLKLGDRTALIGVVVETGVPRRTRNGSWAITLKIIDPSNVLSSPFRINTFCSNRAWVPSVEAGQGFLINKLNIERYQNNLTGTGADDAFSWVGYDFEQKKHFFSTVTTQTCNLMYHIGPEEIAYFEKLSIWYEAVKRRGVPKAGHNLKKFKTISEAIANEFFGTNVEILKIHTESMVVFATDYTPAPAGFSCYSGDPELQKLGRNLIHIALFDEDRAMGYEMEEGKIYTFSNIRLAETPKGMYFKSGRKDYGCKIDLSYDDEAKAALLRRKRLFYEKLEREETEMKVATDASKETDLNGGIVQAHESFSEDSNPKEGISIRLENKEMSSFETVRSMENDTSQTNVVSSVLRCLYPNQPFTPIAEVKRNEIFPAKFRLKARMIDVRPKDPFKMIKIYCGFHRRELGKSEARCLDCADMMAEVAFSYHITILLEDESGEVLQVGLGAEEANNFFGIDPKEAFRSYVVRDKLIERARPWLGNFWKGQKEKNSGWYTSEKYLDLAVQTWQVEQSGKSNAVYTICGTRLPCNPTSQMSTR